MNKEKKKTMAPRLRFPEFRDAGEWEVEPFSKIYSFYITNSFSRDDLNYTKGTVKNIHYGDIHTKFSILFDIRKETVPFVNPSISIDKIKPESYCVEGDMIFADASEDLNDVGKSIEIVSLHNEKLLSGLHTLLARQLEPKLIIGFGGHLFKSDGIRIQIKKEAQGAKVLGISAGRLSNIQVYYPKDKNEQQKIAATLSSLDNLIAAQSEKIKALQAHKKGLMQRLFPAEGETAPRLRFGEFEGEWESKELGEFTSWGSGGTPSKDNPEYWGGDIPWISASSMRGMEYFDSKLKLTEAGLKSGSRLAKKGSLLLLVRGSMLFNCVPVGIAGKDVAFNQDLKSIVVSKVVDTKYLLYWFLASEQLLMSMVGGTGIGAGKLETPELQKISVPFPTIPEQQKIAATLSSLDDLIAAQGEKLEVLKAHKKGLMQGLFPNTNET